MFWYQWFVHGVLAWVCLAFLSTVLSYVYSFVLWVVHWLPRFTLAWVPGINVVWFLILVMGMGRMLSNLNVAVACPWQRSRWFGRRVLVQREGSALHREVYVLREIERAGQVWCAVREAQNCFIYWIPKEALIAWDDVEYIDESREGE